MQKTEPDILGLPGIEEALRDRLVADLNQNLANLSDLAAAYKQAHWNVIGADFAQLHALFDQFTVQVREHMDVIAERAVALGGAAHGTLHAAAEHSVLRPFPVDERSQRRLLEELVSRINKVDMSLRQAMNACGEELASQDVYIEVVRGIEKQRWMLQAHLA
ncbi:MAG: Ferritin Dps family protein [Dehalococcoidia bacterium]|nr:Ferritin Dps family protein [Dehalococcoidia bacterium]